MADSRLVTFERIARSEPFGIAIRPVQRVTRPGQSASFSATFPASPVFSISQK
jgi:hypothetical protein